MHVVLTLHALEPPAKDFSGQRPFFRGVSVRVPSYKATRELNSSGGLTRISLRTTESQPPQCELTGSCGHVCVEVGRDGENDRRNGGCRAGEQGQT